MSSAVCSWCERVSITADLVGFLGALALAYPFLVGQPPRDSLDIPVHMDVPDKDDAIVVQQVRQTVMRQIVRNLQREYRAAWLGALAIAAAFMMKFISSLF
jgi:hypothetical protein